MTKSPHVILIEFAESDEMRALAVRLAGEGHSIGLLQRKETSENPIDELQLKLEQTGGISCAIKAEKIETTLDKMQDLFGRVDDVVVFSNELADEVSRVFEKIPARKRPGLHLGGTFEI